MSQLLLIALGGATGSVARFLLQKAFNASFPVGTLAVNVIGCFLIGWLWASSDRGLSRQMQLLLMTGFCGGFTTFSAFSLEALQFYTTGRWMIAGFYILASVAGGLLATSFGYKIFSS